jgi:PadR family transcriptional regulator
MNPLGFNILSLGQGDSTSLIGPLKPLSIANRGSFGQVRIGAPRPENPAWIFPLDFRTQPLQHMAMTDIDARVFDRELKKGSAELLILSLVEARPRHGYEISKLIEQRSDGAVKFHVASLYPLLYRLEKRGWIQGRWVEKEGQRRRRYYRLTPEGRKVLASQRNGWRIFAAAVNRIAGVENA